jgi:Ca2+-transporting ATPase
MKVEFLSAVMILWINLVTDSLPALALGTERVEKDIMSKPPRKANSSLFAGHTGRNIIVQGILQTALTMLSFCIGGYVLADGIINHSVAMSMAFLTLACIQLLHAYNSRSQTHSLFSSNPFSNKMMYLSFITCQPAFLNAGSINFSLVSFSFLGIYFSLIKQVIHFSFYQLI